MQSKVEEEMCAVKGGGGDVCSQRWRRACVQSKVEEGMCAVKYGGGDVPIVALDHTGDFIVNEFAEHGFLAAEGSTNCCEMYKEIGCNIHGY